MLMRMLVVSESYQNCQNRAVSNQMMAEGGGRGVIVLGVTTDSQSTQSGHFLGYISSRWKNLPRLVRARGARPPVLNISTITYKVAVYAPIERADTPPLFLLYPNMYSVVNSHLV